MIAKLHADTAWRYRTPPRARGSTSLASARRREELRAYLRAEMDKWGVIIKEAGIKVDG